MSAFAEQHAVSLARRLHERQRAILRALYDHEVLLTRQLEILFFASARSCQRVLKQLVDLQLVERQESTEQVGGGRQQPQWMLRERGVQVVAVTMRKPRSQLSWMPRQTWHDADKYLDHLLGVNRFFVSLVQASKCFPDHGLEKWVKDRYVRTAKSWIRPDGFGRYQHPQGACDFYLEYDRATEWNAQLVKKLRGYILMATNWTEHGPQHFPNVLVVVPQEKRKAAFDKAMRDAIESSDMKAREIAEIPFFISSEELLEEQGILGSVWRSFGPHQPGRRAAVSPVDERVCFLDLPCHKAGPYDLDRCLGRRWAREGKGGTAGKPRPPTFPVGRIPGGTYAEDVQRDGLEGGDAQ